MNRVPNHVFLILTSKTGLPSWGVETREILLFGLGPRKGRSRVHYDYDDLGREVKLLVTESCFSPEKALGVVSTSKLRTLRRDPNGVLGTRTSN